MKAWASTLFWAVIWWGSFAFGAKLFFARGGDGLSLPQPMHPLLNEYVFWAIALFAMIQFGRTALTVPVIKKWLG